MADEELRGDKAVDPELAQVFKRSVAAPAVATGAIPAPVDANFILWLGATADGIAPWGRAPKMRDQQLRQFFPQESYFVSALSSIAGRNAAFSWKLEGGERSVKAMQRMLLNSNRGLGWENLIIRISIDLYTQDSGAFVELIRAGDSPDAPVINVAHLDAGRCYPTGDPEWPVIYRDRYDHFHRLAYYQVEQLLEAPSPVEMAMTGPLWGIQYSALSRCLRAAQIIRSVMIYEDEKLSGRSERAIHLVRGIDVKKIEEALAQHRIMADNEGNLRYVRPAVVGSHNPDAEVGHDTLDFASLPDGFDLETIMKWYISAMALAFQVDYQDFAPLPGGNLGTGQQSQVLHMKSRGKGPALFMKLIEHLMNFMGVLPDNVEFQFDEQDMDAESEEQAMKLSRAQERAARITSAEIDPEAARQLALDAGDLTQEIYDDLEKRAQEQKAQQQAVDTAQAVVQAHAEGQQRAAQEPAGLGKPGGGGGQQDAQAADNAQPTAQKERVPPGRLELEPAVTDHVEDVLNHVSRKLRDRIRQIVPPDVSERADEKAYTPRRRPKPKRTMRTVTAVDNKGYPMQVIDEEVA